MSKEDKDVASIDSQISAVSAAPVEKTCFRWRIVDDHSPPQVYNWTLYLSVFVFGVLGSARGLDEGSISGSLAQVLFKKQFGLSDPNLTEDQHANLKSNIASMVQLGSIGGSLLAMYTVDKFGRIRALQGVCVIWIVAAIIQITSSDVGQLYAGRLIEGFAIGQTTTIGPTYMSEVAPKAIRGLCGCIFAGAVYFGIMMGYFAHYGTALHLLGRIQWVLPTSLKIIFAGLIFIMSFVFCVESPRWYMKVGRPDDAARSLAKLRHLDVNHPYVIGEVSDINEQIQNERKETEGTTIISLFKEVFFVSSVRYRFIMCACMAQLLGQWSGANAITIYSPELMAMIGVTGTDKLKWTAILGVVKFCSAYLGAFFIIDFLGRRRALYIGITIQMICILYFAIYLTIVPEAEELDAVLTPSQKSAGKGAMAALFLSGTGWTMGFNSIQYLIGSEIFPLKVRSFAQSLVMVFHFALQYSNSKALPKMMLAMDNFGAFYFFVGVLILALLWAYIFIPEVSGRSLESMEEVFSLPWYLIGRKGAELCPDFSEVNKISYQKDQSSQGGEIFYNDHSKASVELVEDAEKGQAPKSAS